MCCTKAQAVTPILLRRERGVGDGKDDEGKSVDAARDDDEGSVESVGRNFRANDANTTHKMRNAECDAQRGWFRR